MNSKNKLLLSAVVLLAVPASMQGMFRGTMSRVANNAAAKMRAPLSRPFGFGQARPTTFKKVAVLTGAAAAGAAAYVGAGAYSNKWAQVASKNKEDWGTSKYWLNVHRNNEKDEYGNGVIGQIAGWAAGHAEYTFRRGSSSHYTSAEEEASYQETKAIQNIEWLTNPDRNEHTSEGAADVNERNHKGFTPLILISLSAVTPRIAQCLIGLGATVNARDKAGKTSLDYAIQSTAARGEYGEIAKTVSGRYIGVLQKAGAKKGSELDRNK